MGIRFVTIGGKPNTHNIYYEDWTYRINSDIDISDYEITTFDAVNAAHMVEFPEQYEEEEEL